MPSLKNRVVQHRDTLMARGADMRAHAERVRGRLRHPVVLVPAFLCGVVTARGAPTLLRALPGMTARLRHLKESVARLDTIFKLVAILVPDRLHPSGADSEKPLTTGLAKGKRRSLDMGGSI